MDTASFQFLAFGLAAALVSNFSRSPIWRSIVLFAASVVFIGLLARNAITLLPLAAFLLLGYVALLLTYKSWGWATTGTIPLIVFLYIWLKKYTFLPPALFLHFSYFTLGLSYIFFRVLHLVIESRDNRYKMRIGLGSYLLYTLNFTTLVSGPIDRYDQFALDQFAEEPLALGPRVIGLQLERIVRGFFKVNVLATIFNMMQENALSQLSQSLKPSLMFRAAFTLAVVYPFFLYANFSGYIDIVIAIARLMRVRLPENFDRPFSATSFIDFWNRWHITLSTWLKTYVYNPLLIAMMRRTSSIELQPWLGVLSFFVTFFLIGLWHGRTSEFIIFGVLQGGGVAINKLWQLALTRNLGRKGYKALADNAFYRAISRGLTFSWFAFTLFWFWADWAKIATIYRRVGGMRWLLIWLFVWLLATVVLALWEWLRATLLSVKTSDGPILTSRYARVVYATTLAFIALVMTVLLNQAAPDIVYKAF